MKLLPSDPPDEVQAAFGFVPAVRRTLRLVVFSLLLLATAPGAAILGLALYWLFPVEFVAFIAPVVGLFSLAAAGMGTAFLCISVIVIIVETFRGPFGFPLHHCQKCGYNLTGNTSGICPECGVPMARHREDSVGAVAPTESRERG